MKPFYKPIITIAPSFFFILLFYLGHRIPLLGVLLGGFLAASIHGVLTKTRARERKVTAGLAVRNIFVASQVSAVWQYCPIVSWRAIQRF